MAYRNFGILAGFLIPKWKRIRTALNYYFPIRHNLKKTSMF